MKQQPTPKPEASQSQTLRSWFLWTIGGTLLCAVFWFYQLEERRPSAKVQTIEAAASLPDLGSTSQAPAGKFQVNPLKPE